MAKPPLSGSKRTSPAAGRTTLLSGSEALIKVAWLYYHRKLTQRQIALEVGVSRPTVMRLLQQAVDRGLVTITLRLEDLERLEISAEFVRRFRLSEALVVPTAGSYTAKEQLEAVGRTGALYLRNRLTPDSILTVAWGKALFQLAQALPDFPVPRLVLAQAMGGLNSDESSIPSRVTSLIAEKLHARAYHLYVPAIVANPNLREILLNDAAIRGALEVARRGDYFLTGIGKVGVDATVVETGFLDLAMIDRLRSKGAVGDIATHYFDIRGNLISDDLEDRIMGLSWADLAQAKKIVALAAGADKTSAVLGALRTGIISVLIIDYQTARAVLDLAGPEERPLPAQPGGVAAPPAQA